MYKLVIIDDETYILNQLVSLLDWKELGFEIAKTFEVSEDIFDYLQNNEVDAILSDISMPYPSGLDIAKYCSEHYPDIPIILISGYRDFEYAKQAIKYNVFEYVTKPISYDSFYNCINALSEKLNSSKNIRVNHFIDLARLSSFQEIFFDLLYGRTTTVDELHNAVTACGLDENSIYRPCAILSVHIDNYNEFVGHNRKYDINNIYNAICNIIPYETESAYNMLTRYAHSTLEILVINKNESSDANSFDKHINLIKENFEEILKLKVSIGISKTYTSLAGLISGKESTEVTPIISADDVVNKVMEYIKNNYKNEITLDDIARYTAMSKGYFCSYYKNLTSESFITTLNNFRIEKAKELLKDPSIKASTIGQLVGFKNTQHFYRVFKSITGCTPNIYQTRMKNNE